MAGKGKTKRDIKDSFVQREVDQPPCDLCCKSRLTSGPKVKHLPRRWGWVNVEKVVVSVANLDLYHKKTNTFCFMEQVQHISAGAIQFNTELSFVFVWKNKKKGKSVNSSQPRVSMCPALFVFQSREKETVSFILPYSGYKTASPIVA